MVKRAKKEKDRNAPASVGLVDFDTFLMDAGASRSTVVQTSSIKVEEIHQVSYDEGSVVDFESYVDGFGHPEFLEDKKSKFVTLVSDLLGVPDDEAAATFDAILQGHFKLAAENSNLPENHLCVPEGEPEKYLGKGKSGEIYAFLRRVYPFREGAEPLTIGYLQESDPKALVGFRSRRQTVPVPADLLTLTREGIPSRQKSILQHHNVNLSTSEGQAEAKKLMSAISNALYPR